MKSFKDFVRGLDEETNSGDIAPVMTKLDLRAEPSKKGKRCKDHKKLNCGICNSKKDERYN